MSDTISVKVIKPFEALRTPCPPVGTVGELHDIDGEYYCVKFRKPMIDTEGGVWPPSGDETEYIWLKFLEGEIEEV